MLIGIDASRAFAKERTGIEEYSYQIIKCLRQDLSKTRVVLYLRPRQVVDFDLPVGWRVKKIHFPFLWTQLGLSLEILFHPIDVLFVPAHVTPIFQPRKTIVTVHGLEYEFFPQSYSFWERFYMRWSIKLSCRRAKKVIVVSENTKKDLMRLYRVSENKIRVIYEGISEEIQNFQLHPPEHWINKNKSPYLLFIGRLEARKNITGIIEAFEILKEKYHLPHQLILVGKRGYGYKAIKVKIGESKFRKDIKEVGFVSEEEKIELLRGAEVFLFPTFYEGFGLPILEAQALGVPVVTSDLSSMPEIAGAGALLVDPRSPEKIAEAVQCLVSQCEVRSVIIKKGRENTARFSWKQCAQAIARELGD
jgi:glycosyltransferase involved in cell wall biosynthesis